MCFYLVAFYLIRPTLSIRYPRSGSDSFRAATAQDPHSAAAPMFQAMIPFGVLKPPCMACCFSLLTSKNPGGMCQPHSFLRKPHGWQSRGHPCVCWNPWKQTATPSKCVHLFVAIWELVPCDDQPPAILRLESKEPEAKANCGR